MACPADGGAPPSSARRIVPPGVRAASQVRGKMRSLIESTRVFKAQCATTQAREADLLLENFEKHLRQLALEIDDAIRELNQKPQRSPAQAGFE